MARRDGISMHYASICFHHTELQLLNIAEVVRAKDRLKVFPCLKSRIRPAWLKEWAKVNVLGHVGLQFRAQNLMWNCADAEGSNSIICVRTQNSDTSTFPLVWEFVFTLEYTAGLQIKVKQFGNYGEPPLQCLQSLWGTWSRSSMPTAVGLKSINQKGFRSSHQLNQNIFFFMTQTRNQLRYIIIAQPNHMIHFPNCICFWAEYSHPAATGDIQKGMNSDLRKVSEDCKHVQPHAPKSPKWQNIYATQTSQGKTQLNHDKAMQMAARSCFDVACEVIVLVKHCRNHNFFGTSVTWASRDTRRKVIQKISQSPTKNPSWHLQICSLCSCPKVQP